MSPKVVSDRNGHANVGFFLETYACGLKKDDREAAERAASFLLGPDLNPSQKLMSMARFTNPFTNPMRTAPGVSSEGRST